MSLGIRRAWFALNIVMTLALLPALFPDAGAEEPATVVDAGAPAAAAPPALPEPTTTSVAPSTTSTTAAPAPKTAAAPAHPPEHEPAPPTTTTTTGAPRPTTTTTHAPPPPAPAAPVASGSESGRATWYDYQPGICAHKTLPFGTVVTVNAVNGKSVQCTVGDRGPFVEGYVIDLHWQEFEQLASRDTGRIDVTITW